ncbi:hypothetical protein L198_07232 [Cryptococcus wingfieldii CBS 7118]|uniref:Uncharacterized protein n=1 Tax=Cryptococcus wingfieldii CBS 7118 TaxID=1295528 RepID=A0A1E3IDG1_9TREE|nr:hypothetical protein L198_07232 [Cryptococcus wingfieldii CBS 7118]ODN86538.1 hypothetical protein L198_07232 [Cryptococcus wingfieldii CBS 7118]
MSDPSPLPSTWDACDSWATRLENAVSSVPPLTGASNYHPWAKKLQIVLSGVRGCLCLLDEPPDASATPSSTSPPAAILNHLDATLALVLVGLLSPALVSQFESVILDHPSRAARTLWLKLEAAYGTRWSFHLWQSVQALSSQPQGSTPVTEFMTSRKQKFEALKAAGYDFDRWFLDNLVADLAPHFGPTVRGLDFATLTFDSLYAAVRGVDDSHRLHAAPPSSSMTLAAFGTPVNPRVPSSAISASTSSIQRHSFHSSPLPRTPSVPPHTSRPGTPPLPPSPVTLVVNEVTIHRSTKHRSRIYLLYHYTHPEKKHSTTSRWDSFPAFLIPAIRGFWASTPAPPLLYYKERALALLPPTEA